MTAYPGLAERLGPLHATHVAHVAVLLDLTGRKPAPPSADPGPSGVWTLPQEAHDGDPADPDDAVAALRAAEQAAQDEAAQACLVALAEQAVLLGTIAAARATHVRVLA